MNRKSERVFVVEDEILVAMYLADLLTELGHRVVETATRIPAATEIAQNVNIDLAILDINVAGETSFPVADVLRDRGIPVIFATGYGPEGVADDYQDHVILEKPYTTHQLQQALDEVLSG